MDRAGSSSSKASKAAAQAAGSGEQRADSTLLIRVKPKRGTEEHSPSDPGNMAKVSPVPDVDLDERPKSPHVHASSSVLSNPQSNPVYGGSGTEHEQDAGKNKGAQAWSLVHYFRHGFRLFLSRSGWYDSTLAVSTRRFIRGRAFSTLAMVALMLALFLSDMCVLAQVNSNTEQDFILLLVFAIFLFEFLGLVFTDASYLFGFFFWMDLLGTLSMIFDISFMVGNDATQPERRSPDSGRENLIVVRAARATKLGARAGRLSRVLKLLRFLPFVNDGTEEGEESQKVAKVISGQLMNVISTRVAFLSICIVIVLPFLGMMTYPEMDDSMGAWTQLLSLNVMDYHAALDAAPQDANVTSYIRARLDRELARFASFYEPHSYGPYSVCYGQRASNDMFNCNTAWTSQYLGFVSSFASPARQGMVREMSSPSFMVSYDLSTPKQLEAIANMGLICFIIVVMCVFGLVTSSSISNIALKPLERMLSVVRERCSEIFKYTNDLEADEEGDEKEEDYDDMEKAESSSEFALLERVVTKLTAIAHVTMITNEPQVREGMGEDEIMTLNWMQGGQSNVALPGKRNSVTGSINTLDTTKEASDDAPFVVIEHKKDIAAEIIESLETDAFDCFVEVMASDKRAITFYVIKAYEGCEGWAQHNVQERHLVTFIDKINAGYNPNPWHNYDHALDVLYQASRYMTLIEANLFFSEVCQFQLMVACIGHDVGHPGINNQFLVETSHELALRYNDRSPLENMHCARLFQVLSDPQANIFATVEKELYKEMRKGIIAAILHTDVIKHNEMVKELSLLYQMNSECFDALEPNPRFNEVLGENNQLVMNMLLHGADMSNPMRPWDLCHKYAGLCMDEFFNQGDQEKQLGIPVQMLNDREKINKPNSQVGFIEFMIAPMAEAMVHLFAPLDGLTNNLAENVSQWCNLWIEETSPNEEATLKVKARVDRICKRCKAVTREERAKALCL